MSTSSKLPPVKEKKRINLKEFVALAAKVKKTFEEEEAYLEEARRKNENRISSRFLINS